jgi:phage terminase small subunit
MALTGKKLAFAKALLAGKSNREAAITAGYSEKTASPQGSRLAKDVDVKAYLVEMRKRAASPPKKAPPATPKSSARSPFAPGPDLPDDDLLESDDDPREFLRKAMKNAALDPRQRIDAAKALLPYEHPRIGEGGKKDAKADAAKKAANKFGTPAAPGLKRVK